MNNLALAAKRLVTYQDGASAPLLANPTPDANPPLTRHTNSLLALSSWRPGHPLPQVADVKVAKVEAVALARGVLRLLPARTAALCARRLMPHAPPRTSSHTSTCLLAYLLSHMRPSATPPSLASRGPHCDCGSSGPCSCALRRLFSRVFSR